VLSFFLYQNDNTGYVRNEYSSYFFTIIPYIAILIIGFSNINNSKIFTFFLLKTLLGYIYLGLVWNKELYIANLKAQTVLDAYDAMRYYWQSANLAIHNFDFSYIIEIEHISTIYFFASILYLFSCSIFSIHSFVSLISYFLILGLNRYITKSNATVNNYAAILLIIIIPEIAFFQAISSKECITSILFGAIILTFLNLSKKKSILKLILLTFFCSYLIALRIYFILYIILILFVFLYFSQIKAIKKIIFILLSFLIILVFYFVFQSQVNTIIDIYTWSADLQTQKDIRDFSSNSFALAFSSDNIFIKMLISPIFLLTYIISPIQIVLITPFVSSLDLYISAISSFIYVLIFPRILLIVYYGFRNKTYNNAFIVTFIGLLLLYSTANSNVIIHERYRVPFMLIIMIGYVINSKNEILIPKKTLNLANLYFRSLVILLITMYNLYKIGF